MFKIGDIVEFSNPNPDEIGVTYTFAEDKGDRCLIREYAINGVVIDRPLLGTTTVRTADLKKTDQ